MNDQDPSGHRRRRVGGDQRAQQTIRITPVARELAEELRKPGILMSDGCTLGDVFELALRDLEEAKIIPD
jgi:hypothetical protein